MNQPLNPKREPHLDSRAKFQKALKVEAAKNPGDVEIADLYRQVASGSLGLADFSIMTTKNASGRTDVSMFQETDEREVGINTIAKGRLEKGQYMLVDKITLIGEIVAGAAIVRGSDAEKIAFKTAVFNSLNANIMGQESLCIVANGQTEIRVRQKNVLNDLANTCFVQDNNQTTTLGTIKLENAFFVRAQEAIELNIDLGVGAAPNTLLRAYFHGTATVAA